MKEASHGHFLTGKARVVSRTRALYWLLQASVWERWGCRRGPIEALREKQEGAPGYSEDPGISQNSPACPSSSPAKAPAAGDEVACVS